MSEVGSWPENVIIRQSSASSLWVIMVIFKLRTLVMFSLNLMRDRLAPQAASKTGSVSERLEVQVSGVI